MQNSKLTFSAAVALGLTATATFAGSALAADLPARTYSKAPAMVAPVANWTGCYVAGGGGYGVWDQEAVGYADGAIRTQTNAPTTTGGRGYLGTVGAGCDYQFAALGNNFVVGAFGDYDFSSLKGKFDPPSSGGVGDEKMSSAWSIGGRAGWLVTPNLLTYFSGGYTQASIDRVIFTNVAAPFGVPNGFFLDKHTYKGYFLGAGDEYAVNFLPGLFWKTEYRLSQYDRSTNPILATATGLTNGFSLDNKIWVQSVRSELVYRFNWSR